MAWHLDVSTCLPLPLLFKTDLGLQSRLIRPRFLGIFAAAPVVGVSSYLFDCDAITQAVGPYSLSLHGGNPELIRNMRVSHLFCSQALLGGGKSRRYRIRAVEKGDHFLTRILRHISASELSFFWTLFTWAVLGVLLEMAFTSPATSSIGVTNLMILSLGSIGLRVIDRLLWIPSKSLTSFSSEMMTAVFTSGESSVTLEGREDDILSWTRGSLRMRRGFLPSRLKILSQAVALSLTCSVFYTITYGTTEDRLLLLASLILGYLNAAIGPWLQVNNLTNRLMPIGSIGQSLEKYVPPRELNYLQYVSKQSSAWVWLEKASL